MPTILLALALASGAVADRDAAVLRDLDRRLATVAFRLVTGNAALCRDQEPATGLVLHALGQYPPARREQVRSAFGFEAAVAVEAVVAGSPAALAGVQDGDSLVAIDGVPVEGGGNAPPTVIDRDAALLAIILHPPARPLALRLRRGGGERDVAVTPVPGCAVAVEGVAGRGMAARADARMIQIPLPLVARLDDPALAAVVAHELAHVILRHHDRLAAAGREPALVRRSEDEADALSPALLYNAGYDPGAAARLWRTHGSEFEGAHGLSHGSAREREAATAAAATAIPAGAPRPWRPLGAPQ